MVKVLRLRGRAKGDQPAPTDVPQISREEAKEHTRQINLTAQRLAELLREANTKRVHKAMGYDSFARYSMKEVSQVIKRFF